MQSGIEHVVFLRDAQPIRLVGHLRNKANTIPFELSSVPVPSGLFQFGLNEADLRLVLQAYLGHLDYRPRNGAIGIHNQRDTLFQTGVVGLDGSLVWQSNLHASRKAPFNRQTLYAAGSLAAQTVLERLTRQDIPTQPFTILEERYPCAPDTLLPCGGSLIMNTGAFNHYQSWLRDEIPFVLESAMDQATSADVDAIATLFQTMMDYARGWFLAVHLRPVGGLHLLADVIGGKRGLSLREAAQASADRDKNLVIVFANSGYKTVLRNWLAGIERIGNIPLLIVAMDDTLEAELAAEGVNVTLSKPGSELSDIWRLRMNVIRDLVEEGYNVLHSDADAFWHDDATEAIFQESFDIIASQGTIHPPQALNAWKKVLCFGFIYFKATQATRDVLADAMENHGGAAGRFDDQAALNNALVACDLSWDVGEAPYDLALGNKPFECFERPVASEGKTRTGQTVRVSLLPHREFQRLPNDVEDPDQLIVSHPFSQKTADGTEARLRLTGSWILN